MTIPFDVKEKETAGTFLLSLAETVAARLRKDQVKASVIAVEIVYYNFEKKRHQGTLLEPTNITNEIYAFALRLFEEMWSGTPIRH
jgi:DNA polymerase-4